MEKQKLIETSIAQHRLAKKIAEALRSHAPSSVTYVISHEIIIENSKPARMITRIHEYPEIRVHHAKTDAAAEYLLEVDLPTLVDSE